MRSDIHRKLVGVLTAVAIVTPSCGDGSGSSADDETSTTRPAATSPATGATVGPPEDPAGPEYEPVPWPGNVVAATAANAWIETDADADVVTLTIEALEPEGEPVAADTLGEAEAFAAFELGPDGTVFEKPVIVSVVVPPTSLRDDGVPAISASVSHADGPHVPVDVTLSRAADHVVARAAVHEFSTIRFALHPERGLALRGDYALPVSLFWASGSRAFNVSVRAGGVELGPDAGIETVLLERDGAALDWRTAQDDSLDIVARCTEVGEGSYAVGVHLGGGSVITIDGPSGPFAPIECKRLIAPLDPPDGFSVVYATCGGHFAELTNLDPDALARAADALGVAFEHRHYEEEACDSHNAAPPAELGRLGADVYLTHLGLESLIRGDRGGETGRDGETYPEPPADLSSIYVPVAPGAPDWVRDRQLTAFETWLVLHGAVRDRLDPDITDSGSIDWGNHPVLGADPIDVEGFEAAFQQQWNTPLE